MAKGAILVKTVVANGTTGSFSKLQIAGHILSANVGGEAEFADIQWGHGLEHGWDGTYNPGDACQIHSTVVNLEMSGSVTIEGPIAGFKLTNGSVDELIL